MATDRIEREIVIGAPPQRVWQVLTEAEHVSRWFGDTSTAPGASAALASHSAASCQALRRRQETASPATAG